MEKKFKNFLALGVSLSLPLLAGFVGSLYTMPAARSVWYDGLVKSALNPPAWVFGPVWTLLYLLMGVAVFLVWREYDKLTLSEVEGLIFRRRQIKIALGLFIAQLILNSFWSIIFFALQNPGWALVEIGFLWLAILATIIAFAKISRLAGWLLIPYLLWVSLATYLNAAIWWLN